VGGVEELVTDRRRLVLDGPEKDPVGKGTRKPLTG
jgi:hypothetical protein